MGFTKKATVNRLELENLFGKEMIEWSSTFCAARPLSSCEKCIKLLTHAVQQGQITITEEKMANIKDQELKQIIAQAICLKVIGA